MVKKISGQRRVTIDTDICVRCGKCMKNCPEAAIIRTGENSYVILEERCVRCYRCKENCPKQAIRTEP